MPRTPSDAFRAVVTPEVQQFFKATGAKGGAEAFRRHGPGIVAKATEVRKANLAKRRAEAAKRAAEVVTEGEAEVVTEGEADEATS